MQHTWGGGAYVANDLKISVVVAAGGLNLIQHFTLRMDVSLVQRSPRL